MKKLIFSAALLMSLMTSAQQTFKLTTDGKLESTKPINAIKYTDSGYTLVIDDVTYKVFVSQKGKYFINRISAKTAKIYKQYINIE